MVSAARALRDGMTVFRWDRVLPSSARTARYATHAPSLALIYDPARSGPAADELPL